MTTFKTSRVFAASPAAVFAAFAAPERLAKWWGPNGFTNSFHAFEFKPGGLWRFTMHGPDGSSYLNESTFMLIEADRKVVVEHVSAPHFQLTVSIEADAGGTRVTWEQAFDSPDVAASIEHIVVPANEQNLDRWQVEVQADMKAAANASPASQAPHRQAKHFLAVFTGNAEAAEKSGWNALSESVRHQRTQAGIAAWHAWMGSHANQLVFAGGPIGKTLRVSVSGIADTQNDICGYVVVSAESHEAAAKLFESHPHFSIFPGEAVEIMECLPVPQA